MISIDGLPQSPPDRQFARSSFARLPSAISCSWPLLIWCVELSRHNIRYGAGWPIEPPLTYDLRIGAERGTAADVLHQEDGLLTVVRGHLQLWWKLKFQKRWKLVLC